MAYQKTKKSDYHIYQNEQVVGFITWDNGISGQNIHEPWAFMRVSGRIDRFPNLKEAKQEVLKSFGAQAKIRRS